MSYLVVVIHQASFGPPLTKILAKGGLFRGFRLLCQKNLSFDVLHEHIHQIWIFFIKRGLGWKLNPQTKGSQSYLSLVTLHFLFLILQTSFMPYLVIVTHHASFGHPMTKILAKFRLFGVFRPFWESKLYF